MSLTATATLSHPTTRLDTATLTDIVSGLALAEDLWRPHVLHDPQERTRIRLLATPAYEAWVRGWSPGQSVGLHDHGGANAAFVVVDGELTETASVSPRNRSSRVLVHRSITTGQAARVEAGEIHDVANHTGAVATSIHAYSKPLRSMGFYESPEPGLRGHRVRTLWVEEVPPVLS